MRRLLESKMIFTKVSSQLLESKMIFTKVSSQLLESKMIFTKVSSQLLDNSFNFSFLYNDEFFVSISIMKGKVHGILNASSKICSLVVNGQSFIPSTPFHTIPTLKRFFLFHFQFPFFICDFIILHLFYLHFHSSNNPLRLNTNNKIPFFPFIFLKDFIGFILILCLYLLQSNFGISSFSHPDNALEVCGLLTPLHIVPEWYFLCQQEIHLEGHSSWFLTFHSMRHQKSILLVPGIHIGQQHLVSTVGSLLSSPSSFLFLRMFIFILFYCRNKKCKKEKDFCC